MTTRSNGVKLEVRRQRVELVRAVVEEKHYG